MTNLDPAGFAVYFDLMFSVVLQSVKSQKMSLFPLLMLLTSKEKHLYKKVIITNTNNYSFELVKIDCKTVGFFSKSVKKSVKRGVRVLRARSARASHAPFSASFQTFGLTARAYLNTQKYGLFCSLLSRSLHVSWHGTKFVRASFVSFIPTP